ncbi:GRP family sugar transporter [Fructilactobacillus fructivorans]|uniref:Ribose uptake protein RbsU n=1 Tax=Fructilactobacillus fructivorans TaxID=1614 RepID=A0AAE6TWK1_9LACO|nr:GRP family sugar transporter [Fructilactobacillus fructivorans]KRK57065.1 ribose transporter [Fructilactobacillus fructivorans]QFX92443.1 ribose uptake protein RbsU [Fructilactobacillus fructivorans]RDV64993.1 ribose uptake protein RbsU [Fructilactobacillus fructivorans]
MNILIALLPALGWGFLPIATGLIGGKPINQLMGTTYGALIIAILVFIFKQPVITMQDFWWCLLSGMAWAVGQMTQYMAFTQIGVSRTMPISTGLQLVGTSVTRVIFFGEWAGLIPKLAGFGSIILIIVGVLLTTLKDNGNNEPKTAEENAAQHTRNGLILLVIGMFGYIGYSDFPRVANTNGWSAFLPQTIGMVIMGTIFVIISAYKTKVNPFKQAVSYKNIITGFLFGFGAFFYLISTELNGVATGFTISQMCVVISTFGGIVILHERKTKKELVFVTLGMICVILGGIITSFA